MMQIETERVVWCVRIAFAVTEGICLAADTIDAWWRRRIDGWESVHFCTLCVPSSEEAKQLLFW